MDYEKLYKESLEKAKAFGEKYVGDGLLISSEGSVAKEFNEIFQELCESEDERIRKMLIKLVKKHLVNHERCMAESWLEKQREQKSSWSEEDERMIDTIIYDLERHGGKEDSSYSAEINWLKSLKPNHWKPSEKQLSVLQTAIKDYGICAEKNVLESLYNDIKQI